MFVYQRVTDINSYIMLKLMLNTYSRLMVFVFKCFRLFVCLFRWAFNIFFLLVPFETYVGAQQVIPGHWLKFTHGESDDQYLNLLHRKTFLPDQILVQAQQVLEYSWINAMKSYWNSGFHEFSIFLEDYKKAMAFGSCRNSANFGRSRRGRPRGLRCKESATAGIGVWVDVPDLEGDELSEAWAVLRIEITICYLWKNINHRPGDSRR